MRLKKKNQGILVKWILLGCVGLMIPMLCAIINFGINIRLMKNNIEQISDFMLKNIQHNIDNKLDSILDTVNYYLSDEDFNMQALGTEDQRQFAENVRQCYQLLELSVRANPELEILLYLPNKSYIIDTATANDLSHIHRSLQLQNKLTVSREEWGSLLEGEENRGFLIADSFSYENCGRESLVYGASLLYASQSRPGYLYVSVPTDFIDNVMDTGTNTRNTVLILDRDYRIIGQYGQRLELGDGRPEVSAEQGRTEFLAGGERYVGTYIASDVTDWTYVFCMPEQVYLSAVLHNRNLNLFVIAVGGLLGVCTVIFMQRQNYRPVKRLITILPEKEEGFTDDEFKQIEYNLHRIYDENRSMQNSMENRREYDKEQWLLSLLKGKKNFFRKMTAAELLGEDYQKKQFCLVTLKSNEEESRYRAKLRMDDELFAFVLENIIRDTLGGEYHYVRTTDDDILVYLFLMERGQRAERWQELSREKFQWITEFFQNRLDLELTTTIGEAFDDFGHVESMYAAMLEANEQRYYTNPYGVMGMDMIREVDFSMAGHLRYYNKRMKELLKKEDFDGILDLGTQIFEELENGGYSFNIKLYYVLSIVNEVLMAVQAMTQDGLSGAAVEEVLVRLRQSDTPDTLRDAYIQLFGLLCRTVGEESRESGQMSEKIKRYVLEHYMDCNMNISMIADALAITPRYMSRIFQEQTGGSLLAYINSVRIEQAKLLLRHTSKTVDEIADETGFGNSRTFRRNFQKYTGVTASNYRNA